MADGNTPKHLSNNRLRFWTDHAHQDPGQEISYATRQARESHLRVFAQTLYTQGFNPKPANTRQKHVEAALRAWADGGLSRRTIDNRLATLRWFAARIGKPNIVRRTNDAYDTIPRRAEPDYTNKARSLAQGDLDKVRDPYVRMSLVLQREFGLRQKEALMIRPHQADRGDFIHLEDTWTKGGRVRDVPLLADSQRQALDAAKSLVAPGHSLIPPERRFYQQRSIYKAEASRAGLSGLHGLRHAYAQSRYQALTQASDPAGKGWPPPAAGGPSTKDLRGIARHVDRQVRLQISQEMGHSRLPITYVYLGK